MDIDYKNIEFIPVFRQSILNETKLLCREEYTNFMKLFKVFVDLDEFLASKCKEKDNSSKQYFTRLLNIRVKDHFLSAIILASQGFIVDAISLIRSAMEDLFLILNFYLDNNYFKNWHENKDDFKIKPGKLRNNSRITKEDRKLYNMIYKALCNIVHPRKNSLGHMVKFHPTVVGKGTEGIIRIKKDIKLINLSFFIYIHQVSKLLKKIYKNKEDMGSLDTIIHNLSKIRSVYDFIENLYEEKEQNNKLKSNLF
ncbi:hypothetical protein TR13x_01035 [Caloranaerobacter sp. TR13]|uniref:hypothetical protein n=1 Tax=Caloranaerobacter sp. TR13 TaxID=1302151 RepID=UPI0006D47C5E|nr:hypothetical protein [Caloranaerobacter sp. TR13]KPU27964.1 hypothetical protein TR13x_01035 [Caloranaerobacter sp. TR13]